MWQGDFPEGFPCGCAVDGGGLIHIPVDLLQACKKYNDLNPAEPQNSDKAVQECQKDACPAIVKLHQDAADSHDIHIDAHGGGLRHQLGHYGAGHDDNRQKEYNTINRPSPELPVQQQGDDQREHDHQRCSHQHIADRGDELGRILRIHRERLPEIFPADVFQPDLSGLDLHLMKADYKRVDQRIGGNGEETDEPGEKEHGSGDGAARAIAQTQAASPSFFFLLFHILNPQSPKTIRPRPEFHRPSKVCLYNSGKC